MFGQQLLEISIVGGQFPAPERMRIALEQFKYLLGSGLDRVLHFGGVLVDILGKPYPVFGWDAPRIILKTDKGRRIEVDDISRETLSAAFYSARKLFKRWLLTSQAPTATFPMPFVVRDMQTGQLEINSIDVRIDPQPVFQRKAEITTWVEATLMQNFFSTKKDAMEMLCSFCKNVLPILSDMFRVGDVSLEEKLRAENKELPNELYGKLVSAALNAPADTIIGTLKVEDGKATVFVPVGNQPVHLVLLEDGLKKLFAKIVEILKSLKDVSVRGVEIYSVAHREDMYRLLGEAITIGGLGVDKFLRPHRPIIGDIDPVDDKDGAHDVRDDLRATGTNFLELLMKLGAELQRIAFEILASNGISKEDIESVRTQHNASSDSVEDSR